MKRIFDKGTVSRDWFGIGSFLPGPRFTRESGRLFLLEAVGSTNAFLRGKGEPAQGRLCSWDGWGWKAQERTLLHPVPEAKPGTVVVARRQTAGQGRQGRKWVDCGGLHLSVVVPTHRASFDRGFSVWVGLLTVLVLREEFKVDARLKWPNDIVCGDRKLGGILLEKTGSGAAMIVVAGLGLNLTARRGDFPAALQETATSILEETGRPLGRGEIAGRLLSRVENELDVFKASGLGAVPPGVVPPGLPAGARGDLGRRRHRAHRPGRRHR